MEDTQIVALFFSRSEEAISETSKKYGSYLKTIACNILPSSEDAEEIINDVYLAAWDSIPPKRPSVLKYYLSRIVRNLCFKRVEYLTAEKRGGNADILLSELEECIPDTCRNMEQILEKKTWTDAHPFHQCDRTYAKHMLPATDDILERAVNISIGVVDKGLGSGTGININSSEEEIMAVAKNIREIIASL